MTFLSALFAVAAGMANAVQSGANAQLNKNLEQPILAGAWVYLSGLLGLLTVLLIKGAAKPDAAKLAQIPWWAWLGGLLSIGSTLAGAILAKKLGSAAFTGLTVTAGLGASVLLDHFGWIGFEQHPASLWRLVGLALMIGGLVLVSRS